MSELDKRGLRASHSGRIIPGERVIGTSGIGSGVEFHYHPAPSEGKMNFLIRLRIKQKFLGHPAHSQVSIETNLDRHSKTFLSSPDHLDQPL